MIALTTSLVSQREGERAACAIDREHERDDERHLVGREEAQQAPERRAMARFVAAGAVGASPQPTYGAARCGRATVRSMLPLESVPNFSEGRDAGDDRGDRRCARQPSAAARRPRRPRPQPLGVHARRQTRTSWSRRSLAGIEVAPRADRPAVPCGRASRASGRPMSCRSSRSTPGDLDRARAAALAARRADRRPLGLPVFVYAPPERGPAFYRRGGVGELQRRLDAGELVPDFGPAAARPCRRRRDRRRPAAADRLQRQPARPARGGAGDRRPRPRARRRLSRRPRARARAAERRSRPGLDERRGLGGLRACTQIVARIRARGGRARGGGGGLGARRAAPGRSGCCRRRRRARPRRPRRLPGARAAAARAERRARERLETPRHDRRRRAATPAEGDRRARRRSDAPAAIAKIGATSSKPVACEPRWTNEIRPSTRPSTASGISSCAAVLRRTDERLSAAPEQTAAATASGMFVATASRR